MIKEFFIAWAIMENIFDEYLPYNDPVRSMIPIHKLNPYYWKLKEKKA